MSEPEQSSWIKSIINFFICPHQDFDVDEQYRVRMLVGMLLSFSLVLVLVIISLIVSKMHQLSLIIGIPICLSLTISFIYQLYKIRRYGAFISGCQNTIGLIYLGLLMAIACSGGVSQSPAAQLIVLPPLLAFFLLGEQQGIKWAVLCAGTLLLLFGVDMMGFSFWQTIDPNYKSLTNFLIIAVGFSATCSLIAIYENVANQLRQERDKEHQRYVYLASHDQLTNLANRIKFEDRLQDRADNLERRENGQLIALIYLDLNGFKPINDQYGHKIGDEVLQIVAQRLTQSLRDTDLVARQGGDEFTIMLDRLQSTDGLANIASKLLTDIATPMLTSVGQLSVSGSMGVAIYPEQTNNLDELKHLADTAMYHAKTNKLGWFLYSEELEASDV